MEFEKAERLAERVLMLQEEALGPEHRHLVPTLNKLADVWSQQVSVVQHC